MERPERDGAAATDVAVGAAVVVDVAGFDRLLRGLARSGYRVVGPIARDGAIVLDEVHGVDDLPSGRGDAQDAGRYRVTRRGDGALFGYAVGPHSARRFLSPPRRTLWSATRDDGGFTIDAEPDDEQPIAFVGLRGCDLAAIAVQDHVQQRSGHPDPAYASARSRALVIAVDCGEPASTCFCTSMGTGPDARTGYDLALTELVDGPGHRFVVRVGTERGAAALADVPARPATSEDLDAATAVVDHAAARISRRLDPRHARDALAAAPDHPHWDDVAQRCLSCTNCTLVCPTCFCTSVEDVTDLAGTHAERVERWDSCFALDHSYLHGGSVRASTRSRYRQWLTHKLSTWWDQYGETGCVGCGRCITWCPAAIDLVAEVEAITRPSGGAA